MSYTTEVTTFFVMATSLDKVLQPDGTYKWELVDLNDAYVGRGDAPAEIPAEPARKRRLKTEESPTTPKF
jgi:hypothetical protein